MVKKNDAKEKVNQITDEREFKYSLKLKPLKKDKKELTINYTEDVSYIELFNAVEATVAALSEDGEINYNNYEPTITYIIFNLFTDISTEGMPEAMDLELTYDIRQTLMEDSAYVAYCVELIEKSVWRQLDYIKAIHTNKKINDFVDTLHTMIVSIFGNSFTEKTGMDFSEMLENFISKEAEKFNLQLEEKGSGAE